MYSVNQADDVKKIDPLDITQVFRKTLLILWNTYGFFAQQPKTSQLGSLERPTTTTHILDAWLIARTDALITAVTTDLDDLNAFRASRAIQAYVTDLSTWYLKHSRNRTDESFLPTFGWALQTLALVFAPFVPFFSETLWQFLRTEDDVESVHLANWPAVEAVDESLLNEMEATRGYVELALAARSSINQKIRQPLRRADLVGPVIRETLLQIVQTAINVKSIDLTTGLVPAVTLDDQLDDDLRAEGLIRELKRAIQGLRKTAGLQAGQRANVRLSGDHPLWPLIEPSLSTVEAATTTSILRTESIGEGSVTVESIKVSLIIE